MQGKQAKIVSPTQERAILGGEQDPCSCYFEHERVSSSAPGWGAETSSWQRCPAGPRVLCS